MFETLRNPSSFCQFIGDTKIEATNAGVAELVDATDLKSVVLFGRAGSSPALGTCLMKAESRNLLGDNGLRLNFLL